jgi:hypothetical protein
MSDHDYNLELTARVLEVRSRPHHLREDRVLVTLEGVNLGEIVEAVNDDEGLLEVIGQEAAASAFNLTPNHDVPEVAVDIAQAIMRDLSDRAGFDLDGIDAETRHEMMATWAGLITRGGVALGVTPPALAEAPPVKCSACDGCGKVADTEAREPWTQWLNLPLGSSAAVLVGLVKPILCPACGGSGKVPAPKGGGA